METIHRSKMQMLMHDKNGKPKDVKIDYCTQSGERWENVTVRVTSVQNHGHKINVVLPLTADNNGNAQHRSLLDTLILKIDGVTIV